MHHCRLLAPALLLAAGLPGPSGASERATLTVVRAPSTAMVGMLAVLQVDAAPPVTLGPQGCARFELDPGTRQVRYRWRAGALGNPALDSDYAVRPVTLAPGGRVFLRLLAVSRTEPTAGGAFNATTTWTLEPVAEALVKAQLARCLAPGTRTP